MRTIESPHNQTVKLYSKLGAKKHRRELSLYAAEGEKLVLDAVRAGADVRAVLFKGSAKERFENILGAASCEVFALSDSAYEKLSFDASPQGIMAVLGIPENAPSPPVGSALILDRISDPGNLGTVLRSAHAFGYLDVYLVGCTDPYAPRAVRAAMSALLHVRLHECGEAEAVSLSRGRTKLCADIRGGSLYEKSFPPVHTLVIGSESFGVSEGLRAACDDVITVPMREGAESLNAGVAASIIMSRLCGIA